MTTMRTRSASMGTETDTGCRFFEKPTPGIGFLLRTFELLEGVLNQRLVVRELHFTPQQLRRDRHGQVGSLVADLPDRARGPALNLLLGVLRHGRCFRDGLLTKLFTQPLGV